MGDSPIFCGGNENNNQKDKYNNNLLSKRDHK